MRDGSNEGSQRVFCGRWKELSLNCPRCPLLSGAPKRFILSFKVVIYGKYKKPE